jgi:hypothetical protein
VSLGLHASGGDGHTEEVILTDSLPGRDLGRVEGRCHGKRREERKQ